MGGGGILAVCVRDIVAVESPIHQDELIVRLRGIWGLARTGQRIQSAAERAIDYAASQQIIQRDGAFLCAPGQPYRPRDRSDVSSASLRRPEMISPREVEAAILAALRSSFGGSEDELTTTVSKAFGFQSRSAQLRSIVTAALTEMSGKGIIHKTGDLWLEATPTK